MKLYEINERIESLLDGLSVDEHTGEITDDTDDIIRQLETLTLERSKVLEYLAKTILNLRADQAALEAEEKRLKDRRKHFERREASIMKILDRECAGQKTDLGVATVSYRTSETTDVFDEHKTIMWLCEHNHFDCYYDEPVVNKAALKKLIKSGTECPYATVTKHINCSLK